MVGMPGVMNATGITKLFCSKPRYRFRSTYDRTLRMPTGRMPRLSHKKTRTGCQRCKTRKVKCDETRPRCSACARHNVSCEYVSATLRPSMTPPTSTSSGYSIETNAVGPNDPDDDLDAGLEIRLMHEWTAYTCQTFSAAWQFWKYQAPIIAMENRCVLDAMFALAALNASRQSPSQWIPMEGRMVPIRYPQNDPAGEQSRDHELYAAYGADEFDISKSLTRSGNMAFLSTKRSHSMLKNSRKYFDRAIDGHRRGLDSLSVHNVEAIYITSNLVSFHALFTLSETEDDTTLPTIDPILWLRLADGSRILHDKWRSFVGDDWIKYAGVFYGNPDLSEEETFMKETHGAPFEKILSWAEEYESITPEDRLCYEKALGYVALTYRGISKATDHPLISCRRLVGMPSRLPKRFTELVEARSPRALTILAHAFASMKLIAEKVPWFKGIAEQQIPRIFGQIPAGWKEMMKWPTMVVDGEISLRSDDADIRDILSL